MAIRIRTWRWLAKILQATIVLGLPFLRIKGESALRFDIPALTLHFFGVRLAMDEFFLVLLAVLFLTFLAAFLTVLFGRIWCGWLCPQTVVTEITGFLDRRSVRGTLTHAGALILLIPISALLGAGLIWYFVSPYEFFHRLWSHSLGNVIGTLWAIAAIVAYVNFAFIRRTFCATICPYAKMQGMLFDEQTLLIGMDPERKNECMGCDACVRICPVDIDVRKGLQPACVNCAECIDACADRMGRRKRQSLITYRFGIRGGRLALWRKGVVLFAAGAIIFLSLLLYLINDRSGIEIVVVPDSRSMPRMTSDHNIVNMYALTITNRSDSGKELAIGATGVTGKLIVAPDSIRVRGNGQARILVAVKVPESALGKDALDQISITVTSNTDPKLSASQKTYLQKIR